jgi:hypothetical protein
MGRVGQPLCQGVGMAEPYGETVVLRSRSMQLLGVTLVAVAVLGLASAVTGGLEELARFGAPIVLVSLLGWAVFWVPRVEVSDGGVVMVNILRAIHVPWPAVEAVDGRYGLQLRTAYGAYTAWGATAPAGRDRGRGRHSASAVAVQQRLESLREAGWLDHPRLEQPRARTEWHLPLIAATALLTLASVTLPLLT